MKVIVAYTCVSGGVDSLMLSTRFAATFHAFPPGVECEVITVCNGGPLPAAVKAACSSFTTTFLERSNEGWDIGGYMEAARGVAKNADLLVCLGESVYFHRSGWLARIADVWETHGEGMYGPFASNVLRPHLQTTAFATSPYLLSSYPLCMRDRRDRYEFEHGRMSLLRRLEMRGYPIKSITWDGVWRPDRWRTPSDINWKGTQKNCLMWCNHTDHYQRMDPRTRVRWMQLADTSR